MNIVVFDIETKNIFQDVGKNDPSLLDISVVGVYSSDTNKYVCFTEEEFNHMWPIFEKADIIVGYNSEHFDMPLLNKYYHGDLSKIKHIDILKEIKESFGRRMKLDSVAEATLGTKKSGHGLQAITWWKNGEVEKVKQYCIDDVKITKRIFDYAVKHNKLKFKDGTSTVTIPLNTATWLEKKESAMTFSLPF
jgi:hypothetical protein